MSKHTKSSKNETVTTETTVVQAENQGAETTTETTEPTILEPVAQLIVTDQVKPETQPVEEQKLQYDPAVLASHTTKSAKIRYLDACGMKRGAIAKLLSQVYGKTVLYQHVRNVLITPLKRA